MEQKKIKLWILHAGLGHRSPYFYNLCNELKKYNNIEVIVKPELPIDIKSNNGIVYFNRLKRYYDSEDFESVKTFLKNVDKLKKNGWKLIFTLHNFFPIDREITKNDEILLKEFLPKMDLVFTFTEHMKKELKQHFGIEAINHSIGKNTLDDTFDKPIDLSELKDASFIFTFIGNVSEYKMLDQFINAFEKINNKKVYFIIAGPDGRDYKLNYNKNSNIIRINEFIGDSGWSELCSKTDVFVNSYDINRECFKYGFFPSNCIQIMEKKKICIVPKSPVLEEILPNGYYYTYENESDIYKIMLQAIEEKQYIKTLEKSYPTSNYSWNKMTEIIISAIREIMK